MNMIRNLISVCALILCGSAACVRAGNLMANAEPFRLGRVICDDAIEKELIRAGTEFL